MSSATLWRTALYRAPRIGRFCNQGRRRKTASQRDPSQPCLTAYKPVLPLGQDHARLGLTFEGTAHRGIDDARNIARLLPYALGRVPPPALG
jgi:hypothetical protein